METFKSLGKQLLEGDEQKRREAVISLGITKDRRVVPLICNALKDRSASVRRSAAHMLAQIKDPQAMPPLFEALLGKDDVLASIAIDALGTFGEPVVLPLIEVLPSLDEYLQAQVMDALGKIKDDRSILPICKMTEAASLYLRQEASKSLRKFGNAETLPLRVLLSDFLKCEEKAKILEALIHLKFNKPGPFSLSNFGSAIKYCHFVRQQAEPKFHNTIDRVIDVLLHSNEYVHRQAVSNEGLSIREETTPAHRLSDDLAVLVREARSIIARFRK